LNDWFCSSCKNRGYAVPVFSDDGLDAAVAALSPNFTSRFGEIVWAHYSGFGWWPSFIYDPRYTVGSARDLARKNLGRRHLVYFFECHDAPFTVLTNQKLKKWEEGLLEDFHMGKTAKSAGKVRFQIFQQALHAATLELAKPIEMRMDWNHGELPQTLPSPQKKVTDPPRKAKKRVRTDSSSSSDEGQKTKRGKPKKQLKPTTKGFPLLSSSQTVKEAPQVSTKRNLISALQAVDVTERKPQGSRSSNRTTNTIVELTEDGELFIKLLHKPGLPQVRLEDGEMNTENDQMDSDYLNSQDGASSSSTYTNVGFIRLPSRKTSTFSDARKMIQNDLVPDSIKPGSKWRFHVPGLGPVSPKQEDTMGPLFPFLRRTTLNINLGDGTLLSPLKVFLVDFV
jgi:hypothetical protein